MFTVSASWKGELEEQHPDAITSQHRAQAILADHPNAEVKIEGPGFSATLKHPTTEQVAA